MNFLTTNKILIAALLSSSLAVPSSFAQDHATPARSHTLSAESTPDNQWWKGAVIYEIYPRSFQDSNGDGIGDLNGITSRLDYLKVLGVDAIWLTPIYPSPQVDFGYDISDYEAIDPAYGTLADFDHLVAEAKKRDIKIIMDMVMNHTSDKHKWFLESESSKTNPKRDWYVWKDGKAPGQPPNNWTSVFGHSAWQFDPKTNQYYYHKFYIQQPDLNWNNPKVRKAMYDTCRFWMRRGVYGFRLDAIPTLFEDPQLRDEQVIKDAGGNPKINAFGDQELDDSLTNNLPEVHDVQKELRKVIDEFPGRVLIGETYFSNVADLRKSYGAKNDELQLPMDFQVGMINKLDVNAFRQHIDEVETQIDNDQPLLVFDNHDNPRIDARYGDGIHNLDIERMLATVLFATRDTALFYYGDEIAMKTTPPVRKEDVKDPIGITGWPKEKGRDGERTPMQWTPGPNAGFTTGTPWLPIPPSYVLYNVQTEVPDYNSMLNWYKQLIELRRQNPSVGKGNNVTLNKSDTKVLAWARQLEGQPTVVIACNFTADPQRFAFDFSGTGITGKQAKTLMKTPGSSDPASLDAVNLPPFGVYIGQIE
ncbi:Neopullulanase [Acidisarcina polymorpha]|uniref:Neopullulanase n=1 Tax=Acidisarcina polymorpha TaxID=2211140 RepID=A0A2Z5FW00_9BACT|nr:alpha-glucosidase [Acidisarcina polymorpha]AXC11011.1 Neopullulanase [Acidisarcina polymorpha]